MKYFLTAALVAASVAVYAQQGRINFGVSKLQTLQTREAEAEAEANSFGTDDARIAIGRPLQMYENTIESVIQPVNLPSTLRQKRETNPEAEADPDAEAEAKEKDSFMRKAPTPTKGTHRQQSRMRQHFGKVHGAKGTRPTFRQPPFSGFPCAHKPCMSPHTGGISPPTGSPLPTGKPHGHGTGGERPHSKSGHEIYTSGFLGQGARHPTTCRGVVHPTGIGAAASC